MYIPSLPGLIKLLVRRPRLLTVAGHNWAGQIRHRLSRNHSAGLSPPPEQLTVVVTDKCNLRCQMCQYAYSDAPGYQLNHLGHMKPSLFQKLLRETEGRPLISLTGGEPLLHPEINELIAYAHQRGHVVTLTTNGWFLPKQAQKLCAAGLDILVVSVDGPQAVHDRIRGARVFEKLSEGIQTVLALPSRPIVFISMVISDLNYDQLETMHELALSWGVDGLNFNHLWMQTEEMAASCLAQFGSAFAIDHITWDINPEFIDVLKLTDSLEAVQRRSRFQPLLVTETPFLNARQRAIWYQEPAHFIKWTRTRCAWTRLKVWPDGSVKACRDFQVGNIQTEHAMAVWNSGKMRGFRQFLSQHGVMPICARCCYMAHP